MTDFGRRAAVAAANVLPKTGQTTSYHDGDDGYYEAGWEGDRFTDNGDGTITDNATGLMWPDDANGPGGNNGAPANWAGALDYAEGLTFAGHGDWKLPNIYELQSIFDHSLFPPGTYAIITNTQGKYLWTSTTARYFDGGRWWWMPNEQAWWVVGEAAPVNFLCCRVA